MNVSVWRSSSGVPPFVGPKNLQNEAVYIKTFEGKSSDDILFFFWWYPSSILHPYLEIFTGIRPGSRCHVGVWGGQAQKISGQEPFFPKMKYESQLEKIQWTFLFGDHLLGYLFCWTKKPPKWSSLHKDFWREKFGWYLGFFWWYPSSILHPYLEIFTGIRLGSRCHVGVWEGQASKIPGKEPSHPKMKYESHLEKIKWTFLFGDHLLGYPIRWVQFYVFLSVVTIMLFFGKKSSFRLGLDPNDVSIKGALLADAWTGSFSNSRGFDVRRPGWWSFFLHHFQHRTHKCVCVCVSDVYYEVNTVFST